MSPLEEITDPIITRSRDVPKLYLRAPLDSARADLLSWYDQHKRSLPWRDINDPWSTWVSEIMLQQTRVSSVLDYFDRFMDRFPTPRDLAEAEWDEVASLWAGLGYYSRARNLWEGAKQVVERHHGKVPQTLTEIKALKGVGPYTAGAICSIAFDQPTPIVDGNVMRVFARLYCVTEEMRSAPAQKIFWRLASDWAEGERPGDLNQAIMELGATVCTPKSPTCLFCPLRDVCRASHEADPLSFPVRERKGVKRAHESWLSIVISRPVNRSGERREYALLPRPQSGLLGGQWSLPMKRREGIGAPLEGEFNEWFSELSVVTPKVKSVSIKHAFTHKEWSLWAHVIELEETDDLTLPNEVKWLEITDIDRLALGGPSLKMMLAVGVELKRRRGSGR